MPALIITRPDGSVYTEDLSEHEKRIGSSRHNQCPLAGEGIPEYACAVVFERGKWRVVVAAGVEGVLVNGREVSGIELVHGDVVAVGRISGPFGLSTFF